MDDRRQRTEDIRLMTILNPRAALPILVRGGRISSNAYRIYNVELRNSKDRWRIYLPSIFDSAWSFDPELTTEGLVAGCAWIFCCSAVRCSIQARSSKRQIIVFCYLSSVICLLSSKRIMPPESAGAPGPCPGC